MSAKSKVIGVTKRAKAPSTPIDLGKLAAEFGGECDVVLLAVPKGLGPTLYDGILSAAPEAGIDLHDHRKRQDFS